MYLIDAHAHLCDEAFKEDLPEVIQRARDAGVRAIIAVGETLEDAERNIELSQRHPLIKPCAGLYPTELDEGACDEMADFIMRNIDRLVAVGEVGLDYWMVKDPDQRELQRKIFARQVALAKELDLPLNVHSRSAGRYVIELLRELKAEKVLLHAFDGRVSAAREGLEAGYYFSIPPSVVRSRQKQKLVLHLPLDRILLESDCPVLGPQAGTRNEPANISLACEHIAVIKKMSSEEVAEATTLNALTLFSKINS